MEFIVAEFSTGNGPSLQVGNVNPSASSSNLLKEFQRKFIAHTGAKPEEEWLSPGASIFNAKAVADLQVMGRRTQ